MNKTILFIDDQAENWTKVFKHVANYHECDIIPVESISESREQLKIYSSVIDCILLDLKFPEDSMQGEVYLDDLRKSYPDIPVIVLTNSDNAENIRTAVNCIKKGAFDYFGKKNLDLEQLFGQIIRSIETTKSKIIHNNLLKSINKSDYPFILTTSHTHNEVFNYNSHIVYELNSIVMPDNDKETSKYVELAVSWHYDILSLLSLLDTGASMKIRYSLNVDKRTKTKKFNVYIIFTTAGNSEAESIKKIKELFLEVNYYFSGKYMSGKDFYGFSLISDDKLTESILYPATEQTKAHVFVRKNADSNILLNSAFSTSKLSHTGKKIVDSIGLSKYNISSVEKPAGFLFKELSESNYSALDKFIGHFYNQKEDTFFDIIAYSAKLDLNDIRILKELSEDLADKAPSGEAKTAMKDIQSFIDYPSQVFRIVPVLYSVKTDNPCKNLKMAIMREFFCGVSNVETIGLSMNPAEINPEFFEEYESSNGELTNIYSYGNSIELLRLPFPKLNGHKGINYKIAYSGFQPGSLPTTGPVVGTRIFDNSKQYVRILPSDLRKHLYILGQTGTGKSTSLFSMIIERAYSGSGFALLDPHGDLVNDVIENIPEHRKNDVIIFDPVKRRNELAMNILEYDREFPEQKTFIIDELLKIIDDLYDLKTTGGPIFEQYFRNALLLVMYNPENKYTLREVIRVFSDSSFRNLLLEECKDKNVTDTWSNMLKAGGDAAFVNVIPYITSKLTRFLNNHYIEPIVTKRESNLNFREIIDNKKILLIKLTKGKLGDLNVQFFGKLLVNKILMAAFSRENIEEKKRDDFIFFIDEFQNFVSKDIESAMSEARKYHISMVFANQSMTQVDDKIIKSILGNVGSLIFFRPGVLDAEIIRDVFEPSFSKRDMLKLPNYTGVARLQINDHPSIPFVIQTIKQEIILKLYKNNI